MKERKYLDWKREMTDFIKGSYKTLLVWKNGGKWKRKKKNKRKITEIERKIKFSLKGIKKKNK